MLKRFDNPVFMESEEINRTYEGMWVLVKQDIPPFKNIYQSSEMM